MNEYLQAIRENLESAENHMLMHQDNDLQDMIDAYLEMHAFAREVLMAALERDARGQGDDLVEKWEEMTGEVYGQDYCTE